MILRTKGNHGMALRLLAVLAAAPALPALGASPAPAISGYAATNPRGAPISSAPPGAPVLIEGANLGTSGTVAFNGVPAPPPASWSPTEILVTVPAAPSYPFTGPVTVTTNGQTASGPAFTITPPTVSGYAATDPRGVPLFSAPAGAPLLIEGTNLGTSGTVAFGGLPALPPLSWSPTEILVTVPAAPCYPFTGPVTVTTNGRTASGPGFTILPPPPPPPSPTPPNLRPGDLDPSFGTGGRVLTGFDGATDVAARDLALQADGRIVVAGDAGLARYANNGGLDPSFGSGGEVLPDISALAVALQPDGRIVVAGQGGLARYTVNGALDPTFGRGGELLTDFGVNAAATALALQPDGRIVVAGVTLETDSDFGYQYTSDYVLARYTGNGVLDPSFGIGGKVVTDVGSGGLRVQRQGWPGRTLALQPDGQIVLAGGSELVRYTGNGALDPSFGRGGKVLTDFRARAVALQPDGRIVVGGDAELARYTGNGVLDPSFGSGGEVSTDLSPLAVALQPDGRIVVAGTSYDDDSFELARYTVNGALDPTFGSGGEVLTGFGVNSAATALALQPDGRVVVAGQMYDTTGCQAAFTLARYRGR